MLNMIKLLLLAGVVLVVIYGMHEINNGNFNPQKVIEQKAQEASDTIQQMVNNAFQEFTQDVTNDVNNAFNETQEEVTQLIKE